MAGASKFVTQLNKLAQDSAQALNLHWDSSNLAKDIVKKLTPQAGGFRRSQVRCMKR